MSRLFYHVAQDNLGNLLFGVSGTMRLAGTGTAAIIYGDEALTIPIPNPMTNHPSYGSFKCYLGAGSYDFYLAKAGYSFETLTGLQGGGSMANQEASAVAITGGNAALTRLELGSGGNALPTNNKLAIKYLKATQDAITIMPIDNDTGSGAALLFRNTAPGLVGSILTTISTTTYNTTSDARLKRDIAALTGALDVVRALNPVSHRWRADDSHGVGFLAHEVQQVVDGVTTGEKDAVDEAGQIVPQMIDYSKLVPWLVSACQELAQQVEALTARLETAGR